MDELVISNTVNIEDKVQATWPTASRAVYVKRLMDFKGYIESQYGLSINELHLIDKELWIVINEYRDHLSTIISGKTGRPLSAATVAQYMVVVKCVCELGHLYGLISHQDWLLIKKFVKTQNVESNQHEAISAQDQQLLLSYSAKQIGLRGIRDYAIIRTLLDTGMRRAELCALKVSDLVYLQNVAQLYIREGKGSQPRHVPISSYLEGVLLNWINTAGLDKDDALFVPLLAQGRGKDKQWIVDKRHMNPQSLYRAIVALAKKAGIRQKITPHCFRSTVVTDMRKAGRNDKHTMKITGHKNTDQINNVYDRGLYNEPVVRLHQLPAFEELIGVNQ